MQSNGNTIFVGVKVNDRLRDQLDSSQASMKSFFNDHSASTEKRAKDFGGDLPNPLCVWQSSQAAGRCYGCDD